MPAKLSTTPAMAKVILPTRSLAKSPFRHPRQCLYQSSRDRLQAYRASRTFSTTPASAYQDNTYTRPDRRTAKGTSAPKIQQAQAMAKGTEMPTDFGLIPQTFVMPTGNNLPSWVRDFRQRCSMEWNRLRAIGFNLGLSLNYKFFTQTKEQRTAKGRPVLNYPFRKGRLTKLAEELHRDMYTAVAEGDVSELRKLCADGIYLQLRARVSHRSKGEKVEWQCERVARPKLVSHRCTTLPLKNPDGSSIALRQVVVRLVTRQALKRTGRKDKSAQAHSGKTAWQRNIENQLKGRGVATEAAEAEDELVGGEETVNQSKPRTITEFVVMQRTMSNGAEEPWIMWGMTEETTVARLAEMKEQMAQHSGRKALLAKGGLESMQAGAKM